MIGKLGYEYRADGHFLIAKICRHCGAGFAVHAMQPTKPEDAYGLCPACEAVRKMEMEEGSGKK